MTGDGTTRAKLLTPSGAGAIGVIRITGRAATDVVRHVFRPAAAAAPSMTPNRVQYGVFLADDQVIDDGLCSMISHDGEVTVDLCTHGGIRIIERLLVELERLGATVATGPLSRGGVWRVENRIQHEVVEALQRARTERGVRFLAHQYVALPLAVSDIADTIAHDPGAARSRLTELIDTSDAARRLIQGATVAIVGPPNAGKSTLFNRLLGRRGAVVTNVEGTTRDWIRESVEIDGVAIELMDTPGRRADASDLEYRAMDKAQQHVAHADLRLIVVDASVPLAPLTVEAIDSWKALGPHVLVGHKADLASSSVPVQREPGRHVLLPVSAQTGFGVDNLSVAVMDALGVSDLPDGSSALMSPRQAALAAEALARLDRGDPSAETLIRELLGDAGQDGDR